MSKEGLGIHEGPARRRPSTSTKDSHPQYFEPDCFYSDEEPITLGNVTIHSMLTPGQHPLAAPPSSGK